MVIALCNILQILHISSYAIGIPLPRRAPGGPPKAYGRDVWVVIADLLSASHAFS